MEYLRNYSLECRPLDSGEEGNDSKTMLGENVGEGCAESGRRVVN